jgi:hypothetical protein
VEREVALVPLAGRRVVPGLQIGGRRLDGGGGVDGGNGVDGVAGVADAEGDASE